MKLITNRKYFLLFFIFYVFTNTLCLQFFGITRNPLFIPVFLWGLLLLGYDLWKKELFYKNSHLGIIGLYGVVLLLATYLNKTYSNFDSYLIWGMQMIVFLLIFGKKKGMSLTMLKDEMRSIIPFTTILTLAASGLSLLTFFLNISLTRNGWYLGLVAFEKGTSGDILVQKAPACTIEVLAQAVKELFEVDNEIKVIGIRHGEKMYEALLTDEECANAIDMGDFFRVPADKRDLNYDKYVSKGMEKAKLTQFNSNNTKLMNVEEVKAKLLTVPYFVEELEEWIQK